MPDWQLLVTPQCSALSNMERDIKLFNDFEKGQSVPTVNIYSWQPKCISLGYSQKVDEEIDLAKAKQFGWDIVKRPTGGGIVFHNEAEVTYSVVMALDNPLLPKGLVPSYKKLSGAVVEALSLIGIQAEIATKGARDREIKGSSSLCFSYPADYEIVAGGKKIVGSAQKRGKKALLQQGSIFVRRTEQEAFAVLKKKHQNVEAVSVEEILGKNIEFKEVRGALVRGFELNLGIKFIRPS